MSAQVIDNAAKHRFEITVDGHTAIAEYQRIPGAVVLTHTVVPKELGGHGIGSKLAIFALDSIRAEGLKVVPQCTFMAGYIEKHPAYADLVAK